MTKMSLSKVENVSASTDFHTYSNYFSSKMLIDNF